MMGTKKGNLDSSDTESSLICVADTMDDVVSFLAISPCLYVVSVGARYKLCNPLALPVS